MDIIFKLHEGGLLINLSVADLKDKLVDQNKTTSFLNYAFQLVDELVKANRIGTARSYKAIANILKAFNNGKDIQFKEINYSFLCRFEAHHHSKGNQTNGLAVYMRTIRAIYNKAIKAGMVEKEYYPFTNYRVKTAPTEKRVLDWDVIQKIITLDLPNDHSCFHARNYFVASYMMYGMNFIDMAFLKKSDYKNGRINYRRRKTGKLYDIKVADSLNQLLSFYIDQAPNSDLFSRLSEGKHRYCKQTTFNRRLSGIITNSGNWLSCAVLTKNLPVTLAATPLQPRLCYSRYL